MMAYRGVQLSYETIRRWCDIFGASYAAFASCCGPAEGIPE
ncbi:MAG TPA: hypothetical protein VK638_36295 [Edaphobacter sp.]|nr:hypothetical protein [Edaphobacter sp.]